MVRTVGILFVSVLCLAACGSQDGPPVSSGQTGEPSASAPPECEAKGGVAIDDYAENATGERSPMEAAASYQRPGDTIVLRSQKSTSATVFVIDSKGQPLVKVEMVNLGEGWLPSTTTRCR